MSRPKHRPYIGRSEAQATAEFGRSATYADEHAASWQVRFDRQGHEPRDLRELVRDLRKAYADEVPGRMHVPAIDDGGTPAYAPEFKRYLMGSDFATEDDAGLEHYVTPFRRCLTDMDRAPDEASRKRAAIVGHAVVGGQGPIEAALAEGVPAWCARDVAERALSVFWRRLSDIRLDLGKEWSAA